MAAVKRNPLHEIAIYATATTIGIVVGTVLATIIVEKLRVGGSAPALPAARTLALTLNPGAQSATANLGDAVMVLAPMSWSAPEASGSGLRELSNNPSNSSAVFQATQRGNFKISASGPGGSGEIDLTVA